jgi:hypothetical protein
VALGQVFLRGFRFSPVSISPEERVNCHTCSQKRVTELTVVIIEAVNFIQICSNILLSRLIPYAD